jgi:hypothetical protein
MEEATYAAAGLINFGGPMRQNRNRQLRRMSKRVLQDVIREVNSGPGSNGLIKDRPVGVTIEPGEHEDKSPFGLPLEKLHRRTHQLTNGELRELIAMRSHQARPADDDPETAMADDEILDLIISRHNRRATRQDLEPENSF